jgi:hypothetical protein
MPLVRAEFELSMQAGPLNGAYAQCMRRPSARESEIAAAIRLALLSLAGLFGQHLDRSLAITRKADLLGAVLTLGATLPLAAAHARPRTAIAGRPLPAEKPRPWVLLSAGAGGSGRSGRADRTPLLVRPPTFAFAPGSTGRPRR